MSAASKKAWANPEVRARMSAASKKALANPEVRARMSAASKKACEEMRHFPPLLKEVIGLKRDLVRRIHNGEK
jgi:hypothetical protein